jgi:hypothetical protein
MRWSARAGCAATATMLPAATANPTVPGWTASPAISACRLASQASSPAAAVAPTATPSSDAPTPTMAASRTTSRPSCRGVAPTTRSSPNSLVRKAASMDRVLKIRKEPTTSARIPKPRRIPATVSRKAPTPALSSWTARPGSTSSSRPAARPDSRSGASAPGAANTSTELKPWTPSSRRAVARSNTTSAAGPVPSRPLTRTIPLTRSSLPPWAVATSTASPTRTWSLRAKPALTAASPERGARPATSSRGDSAATSGHDRPSDGPLTLPVTGLSCTPPRTLPAAACTPSRRRSRPGRSAGSAGRASAARVLAARTVAVARWGARLAIPAVRLSVSVSVPAMNATPSTTARTDRVRRARCAHRPLAASAHTAPAPLMAGTGRRRGRRRRSGCGR